MISDTPLMMMTASTGHCERRIVEYKKDDGQKSDVKKVQRNRDDDGYCEKKNLEAPKRNEMGSEQRYEHQYILNLRRACSGAWGRVRERRKVDRCKQMTRKKHI